MADSPDCGAEYYTTGLTCDLGPGHDGAHHALDGGVHYYWNH